MIIKVLGSAAGGGFPQWNCACSQCYLFRKGKFQGRSRTQSQLAISSGDGTWHLLNASPDLRTQIEKCTDLQPQMQIPIRQSPIQSVILTNADLDHVLGLLLLREKQSFRIYASESVQKILLEDNSFFGMLRQTSSQTQWELLKADKEFELLSIDGKRTGLWVRPILVSSRFPGFVSQTRIQELQNSDAVLGLVIRESSGKTVGYFPGVGEISDAMMAAFQKCDILFFDGTFWESNELKKVADHFKDSLEIGHIPIAGDSGSISRLSSLKQVRKIFLHINNTNPILDESGVEFAQVHRDGWEVAFDGMEICI